VEEWTVEWEKHLEGNQLNSIDRSQLKEIKKAEEASIQ
jgi:hypothetical protein